MQASPSSTAASATPSTAHTLGFFSLALWWGSLTTLGFVVVPLLFVHLDSAQAAGRMAAQLFKVQTYVSLACAALFVLLQLRTVQQRSARGPSVVVLVALACLASASVQWIIAPQIVAREQLRFWHSLGSGLYLLQWLCVTRLMLLRSRWQA